MEVVVKKNHSILSPIGEGNGIKYGDDELQEKGIYNVQSKPMKPLEISSISDGPMMLPTIKLANETSRIPINNNWALII